MVARRMKSSVKMVGNFWYTCWVDAGQPDLNILKNNYKEIHKKKLQEDKEKWKNKKIISRSHDSG